MDSNFKREAQIAMPVTASNGNILYKQVTTPLISSYCTVCAVVADRAMSILSAMLAIQACSIISHVSVVACEAIKRKLVDAFSTRKWAPQHDLYDTTHLCL